MVAISLLDQLKWGVNSHLIKIHNKYNAFDIMTLQHELSNTKSEMQRQKTKLNIEVELAKNKMLKALNERDDALEQKEEAECTIANQRNYIQSLQKQLSGLPVDEDAPSPSDLSEQLDNLEVKLAQQKKREYNTDTDSSLGSLDRPAKKGKSLKGRKVSLDNVPKEQQEEPKAPKFSYGLSSSQSTKSIGSTQENEFM